MVGLIKVRVLRNELPGDGGGDGDPGGTEGDVLVEVKGGVVPVDREAVGEDEVSDGVNGIRRGGGAKANGRESLLRPGSLDILGANVRREASTHHR